MITAKEFVSEMSVNEMAVVAIKPDPNQQVRVGDKGEMVVNKDGSVTVKFSQHDLKSSSKSEKGEMKFVKKA